MNKQLSAIILMVVLAFTSSYGIAAIAAKTR